MATVLKGGNKVSGMVRGGLKEGVVTTSPYGPAVNEAARTRLPTRSRQNSSLGVLWDLQGSTQGQHGKSRDSARQGVRTKRD